MFTGPVVIIRVLPVADHLAAFAATSVVTGISRHFTTIVCMAIACYYHFCVHFHLPVSCVFCTSLHHYIKLLQILYN